MVDAQAGELDLPGMAGQVTVLYHPVVKGPVVFKLQGAEGVGDALQRVLDGVGEVVHGIDAPLVPLSVMGQVVDPVEHRVPHIEVSAGQIDLGPQGVLALRELAVLHPLEQVQALLDGPVPPGGAGRSSGISTVLLELLRRQLADISQALLDEAHRLTIILVKVIRAVEEPVAPVKAQPVNILLNGVYEFLVLLGGVRVIHPQVAQAAELLRRAEVDGQRLAVPDVQVAVGLRREPGVDGHPLKLAAGADVLLDESVNKVPALRRLVLRQLDLLCHALSFLPLAQCIVGMRTR